MENKSLEELNTKIKILQAAYLILFFISLAMFVTRAPSIFFVLALGSSVVIRVLVVTPLKRKYVEMKREQEKARTKAEYETMLERTKQTLQAVKAESAKS